MALKFCGALLLIASVGLAGCQSGGSSAAPAAEAAPVAKATKQRAPVSMGSQSKLPRAVRDLLRSRMSEHGQDMDDLLWSILFLDFDSAEQLASNIEMQPRLAEPINKDASELNSQIPKSFFDVQSQLFEKARALGEAARAHDEAEVATAYGEVMGTCVACHSLYLNESAN